MALASLSPVPETCQRLINDAYFDAGLIEEGQDANSEQTTNGMRRLNKLVNYFQTKGLKLWLQIDYALTAPTLAAGVGLYTFGPTGSVPMSKPRRVIEAYYLDGTSQTRRPLILMSRNEWDTLATVTTQGTITGYFPDKQQLTLNINLWMLPDPTQVSGAVHFILDTQVGNFSQINDTMQFPPEWALALEWGLADQLTVGQPQKIVERCSGYAERYRIELEDWDVEDASTSFQPDTRNRFVGRRFGP